MFVGHGLQCVGTSDMKTEVLIQHDAKGQERLGTVLIKEDQPRHLPLSNNSAFIFLRVAWVCVPVKARLPPPPEAGRQKGVRSWPACK
mmetsp:Transcript_160/g.165  ORF Transcript_160/g.165 Transcript_160/m.165 type:complete len:88 (-) Transcript_160:512-775(-)